MKRAVFLVFCAACDTYDPHPHRADAGPAIARTPTRYELESRARTALVAWRDTQNAGDVEGLGTLYVPNAPDLAARRGFLAEHPQFGVQQATFESVQNTLVATFTEQRRWPSHAEHGMRRVVFDEKTLIVREEPFSPLPGWEEEEALTSDATALVSPVTATFSWAAGVLSLHVVDSKNAHVDLAVHRAPGHADESIAPAKAALFETRFAGPAGTTDLYRVRQDGVFLVVGHGVQAADILQVDAAKIQLSPGAKVTTR